MKFSFWLCRSFFLFALHLGEKGITMIFPFAIHRQVFSSRRIVFIYEQTKSSSIPWEAEIHRNKQKMKWQVEVEKSTTNERGWAGAREKKLGIVWWKESRTKVDIRGEKQKQIKKRARAGGRGEFFGDEKYFWQIFIQIYVIFYGSFCPKPEREKRRGTPVSRPGRRRQAERGREKKSYTKKQKRDLCAVIICFFLHSSCTWRVNGTRFMAAWMGRQSCRLEIFFFFTGWGEGRRTLTDFMQMRVELNFKILC